MLEQQAAAAGGGVEEERGSRESKGKVDAARDKLKASVRAARFDTALAKARDASQVRG